jgi:DNA-binding transcriptional regulator GbsR (MarR family)
MFLEKTSAKIDWPVPTPDRPALSPVEVEIIQIFTIAAQLLGQPRSVAEIYGLLFISPQPLALDDVIDRLKLSKGGASQGLKYLRSLGAIRSVYVPQSRRTHYEAVAELRKLAGQYLKLQIQPTLEDGDQRLKQICEHLDSLPADQRTHVQRRVDTLKAWGTNTRRLLPVILKMLGG